jgi:hypothetical protein
MGRQLLIQTALLVACIAHEYQRWQNLLFGARFMSDVTRRNVASRSVAAVLPGELSGISAAFAAVC